MFSLLLVLCAMGSLITTSSGVAIESRGPDASQPWKCSPHLTQALTAAFASGLGTVNVCAFTSSDVCQMSTLGQYTCTSPRSPQGRHSCIPNPCAFGFTCSTSSSNPYTHTCTCMSPWVINPFTTEGHTWPRCCTRSSLAHRECRR